MVEIYIPHLVQKTVFALKDEGGGEQFNTLDITEETNQNPAAVNRVLGHMSCIQILDRTLKPQYGKTSTILNCKINYDPLADQRALKEYGYNSPGSCYICWYSKSGTSGCERKNQFFARKRELEEAAS